ncbi:MAG: hypothetical protein DBY18_03400 [Clostridia bacterium]|nr:MAG: hypothetical protein DBY18_03400 [Clostridia bacterium]
MKRRRALGLFCAGLLFFAACGQARPLSLPSVVTAAAQTTTGVTATRATATTAATTAITTLPPTTATTAETTAVTATIATRPPTTVTASTTTLTTYRTTDAPPLPTARPPKPTEKRELTETVRVVCVGDSITKNGYWENNLQGALPETYVVEGFGVNAATALRYGMKNDGTPMGFVGTEAYADSLRTVPDIVVIMLGTNDAKPINWEGDMDNPHQFIIDTTDLVRTYQQMDSAPTVFLALPPTVHRTYSTITEEALAQKVIPALRRVAKVTDAHLIDVHAATANAAEHFADGVHPSDNDGRQCIADEIAAAILTYVTSEKTEKTEKKEKTEGTVCNG